MDLLFARCQCETWCRETRDSEEQHTADDTDHVLVSSVRFAEGVEETDAAQAVHDERPEVRAPAQEEEEFVTTPSQKEKYEKARLHSDDDDTFSEHSWTAASDSSQADRFAKAKAASEAAKATTRNGTEKTDTSHVDSEPASPTSPGGSRLRRQQSKLNAASGAPKTRPRVRASLLVHNDDEEATLTSAALGVNIDNPGKVNDFYRLGRQIGKGSFGSVWKAAVKATDAVRAIKKIALPRGKDKEKQLDFLKAELKISKMLDHPNIVKLFEVFEDSKHLYLVLELCRDRDLSCHIDGKGLSEMDAAVVMQQIFRGVNYMHRQHICHRDLKSQNMLLNLKNVVPGPAPTKKGGLGSLFREQQEAVSQFENAVRITDFGLSCLFEDQELLTRSCGTTTHKSPQVFQHSYTYKCDMWACGIIMYEVISGELPFEGDEDDQIKAKVIAGKVSWNTEWTNKSTECLEVARGLLQYDEARRPTAAQALQKRWFKKFLPHKKAKELDPAVIQNLRGFRKLNKFVRVTMSVIASMLKDTSIAPGRELFLQLDADGDGFVTVKELREKLEALKVNKRHIDTEADAIFKVDDVVKALDQKALRLLRKQASFEEDSKLPAFTYTEFLAATYDREKYITETTCRAAFLAFDKDGSGNLDPSELLDGRLLGELTEEEVQQIVEDLDFDGDGELSFGEFFSVMDPTGQLEVPDGFMRLCSTGSG
eukprot:gb/GFBE01035987.1/.p1 GENE.gb/GFBE01035987.1/~~gb/GFBE01035987.1/.p1  ORF type:complete len:710 (+),score=156.44 gb/GFBE01035987.1/:1-2130(+)